MDNPDPMSPISYVRRFKVALAACLTLLLAACAPQVARPPEVLRGAPEGFPEADYQQLAAEGLPVFRIESERSLVVIEVHRGGSLARVGHDHVIAAHQLEGFIAPDDKRSDLYFRLEDLVVDEPELRTQAKLDTHPSADDITGTRHNMLNAFEAQRYPFAVVHIERLGSASVRASMSLHGMVRTQDVPAQIDVRGDDMTVAGTLALKQTDFGIKPVSVLGGALQVVDEVQVRFSIHARRVR
jgi:YceI-like domain